LTTLCSVSSNSSFGSGGFSGSIPCFLRASFLLLLLTEQIREIPFCVFVGIHDRELTPKESRFRMCRLVWLGGFIGKSQAWDLASDSVDSSTFLSLCFNEFGQFIDTYIN
jgi:hypothetical protein